jgi:RNA polymerase sigma factor (TIGR02999 family)
LTEPELTQLLNADASARDADRLLTLVYAQLRAIAQRNMDGERSDHTLQATALVHEAYLKLVGPREIPWANRMHFYVAAAEAMRRILIDHARARGSAKRGGGAARFDLTGVADLAMAESSDIVRFDELFHRLEVESPDSAMVVRLRFWSGLSVEQTAAALGISTSSVDRKWAFARAWLFQQMNADP